MGQRYRCETLAKDVVYAPADAEVTIVFPTGHAYGLRTANGAEILIHVGIDTVSMNGEGFNQKVAWVTRLKLEMFLEHLTQLRLLLQDLMIQQWLS